MSQTPAPPPAHLFEYLTGIARRSQWVWFGVSLAIAALYGVLALQQAFAGEYMVQDDARQHIFWMQRFVDPTLFPQDLIADYFEGVAPLGYRWLYQLGAGLGVHPFTLGKVLPFFLSLITVSYAYWIVIELFSLPLAGFISSVSLSQSLWYSSEHASATPRAFLYPLLFAFLYYLIREKPLLYLLCLGLQALFYPQIALISLGVLALRLLQWQAGKLSLLRRWQPYVLFTVGFAGVAGLLLWTRGQADFGAVISRAEAIAMAEFQPGGRNAFFRSGIDYWLQGRSGLFHERGFTPATIIAGFTLPLLLVLPIKSRWRALVNRKSDVLLQLLIASLGLFALSHLLLFQLHLPSRYSSHTIRAIAALTMGISWVIIVDDVARVLAALWAKLRPPPGWGVLPRSRQRSLFTVLIGLLFVLLLGYPLFFFPRFPKVGYYDFSPNRLVYEYFAAQPVDSVIASLSTEASNLPMLAARTVLVSPEHAIAYHQGYYGEFRQRVERLIEAQYTTDPDVLLGTIAAYDINFWLLDRTAFQPDIVANSSWLQQYEPITSTAVQPLVQGAAPIMQQSTAVCTTFETATLIVLAADCVADWVEEARDRLF
ncbi:MAG: hypothetical protein AAFO87_08010 [Cyanobacteria bacterium J06607_6]